MPRNSTGFCVAMTKKQVGQIAALAVHAHLIFAHRFEQRGLRAGEARLISSASRMLVKIGPS